MKDVYEEAIKRKEEKPNIPLSEVMERLKFTEQDYKDIAEEFSGKES